MAILLKDTDLTNWYNELNTIRQKTNIALGTVTVPSVDKTKALSSTINTFFNQINALKTNEYLQHAYGWDTWTAAIGDGVQSKEKIVSSLKDAIENQLDNLSLVCGNCIVTNKTRTDYAKTFNNHGGRMSFGTTATTNTTVTRFNHDGRMSFGTTSFENRQNSHGGRMSFGTTATTNTTVTRFDHGGGMSFGTASFANSQNNHGGGMSFGTRSFSERQNDRDGRTTFGTSSFTRSKNSRDGTAGFNRSSHSNTSNQRCSFTARPSCDQTFNTTRDDVLDGNRRTGFLPNRRFSTTSGASFARWTGNSTDARGGNSIRDTTTFGTSSFTERTNDRGGTTSFGTSSFTDRRNSHGGRMSFVTTSHTRTPNNHGGRLVFSTTHTTNTTITTFDHNGKMSFGTASFSPDTQNNHGGGMSFSTTHTTNTTTTTFDHNGRMSFGTSSFSHNPVTTNVTKNMSFQVKDSTAAGQVTNTKIVN